MFILAWSAYGTEACATFAPEYKSIEDTHRALRSAATFMLLVCLLLPLGLGGVDGVSKAVTTGAEGQFYTQAMGTLVGHGAASFFTICIIASLLLSMTSSTSDAGRALFGISRAGMTIKEFGVLNRYHVPARAMTMDLAVNIALVLVIKNNLAILYLSNIGYVMAHVFALSGFLLLRRDRPNWPRPIKVSNGWLPVAAFLCVLNFVFLVVGALAPKLNGYGTWTVLDRDRRARRLADPVRVPPRRPGPRGRAPPRGRARGPLRRRGGRAGHHRSRRLDRSCGDRVMKTILVGVDETDESRRALERAATLAKALQAKVVVTSVAPVTITTTGRSIGADPVEPAAEHRQELAQARAYLEGEGLTAEYVEAVGHEAESILAAARERSADMIVIGSRELTRLQRLLGQSVSDAVAHGARCDVLIVH
jgi:nucleotide-binding universal stress UspA family protein